MVSSIALVLLAIGFHLSPFGAFEMAELPSAASPAPSSESSPQALTNPLAAWDTARRDQQSGEEHRRKGELVPALEDFRSAAKIMERLVALHPENIFWTRDLSLSEDKIGAVLLVQRDLAGAQEHFHSALALRIRFAEADPTSKEWQRNISVSHNKIGDVYSAQGDLKAALESYLAAYGVAQDLVRCDQSNAQWLRDLASCQHRIGSVFLAGGNTSGAMDMYGAALRIEERLADHDPEDVKLQQDLAYSHAHLGLTLLQAKETVKATEEIEKGRAIITALLAKDPNSEQWQKDLTWFDSQLALARRRPRRSSHLYPNGSFWPIAEDLATYLSRQQSRVKRSALSAVQSVLPNAATGNLTSFALLLASAHCGGRRLRCRRSV